MTLENTSTGKQVLGTVLLFSFVMFCVQKVLSGKNIVEGWWGDYPFRARVNVVGPEGNAIPGNNQQAMAPIPMYTVPGHQQTQLSPRLQSTGYGGNISYNLPELKNLALDPANPLDINPSTYANLVDNNVLREKFNYPAGSSSQQGQALRQDAKDVGQVVVNELPLQPMQNNVGASGSKSGSVPLVMDRFIVSPLKSRLFSQSDFIRGDIAIVPVNPNSNPNSCTWFRPSVNPAQDLNPGALAVMGGAYGEQCRSIAQLQQQASGGTVTTAGGVAFAASPDTTVGQAMIQSASMASQKVGTSGMATGGDVQFSSPSSAMVTSFP
jgi:hypothetical protein